MLIVESQGPVYRLTLNRPEVRNAFNAELIEALTRALREMPAETRVVVLAGTGEVFCAGGDLNWMRENAGKGPAENAADALKLAELYSAVEQCPTPVIVAIQGAAFGGGLGLVAAADFAVAAENVKFCFSEVKLGLVPATISPFVLRKIGSGHARALFTTAEVFGATRALMIGLVHEVVAIDQLDAAVGARVKLILAAGPEAVRVSKELARRAPLDNEESSQLLARVRAGEEAREGISAFLEKRKASFVVESAK